MEMPEQGWLNTQFSEQRSLHAQPLPSIVSTHPRMAGMEQAPAQAMLEASVISLHYLGCCRLTFTLQFHLSFSCILFQGPPLLFL